MQQSAEKDFKFHTYVEYYRQKLKAVDRRQKELEARYQNDPKHASSSTGDNKPASNTILNLISKEEPVANTDANANANANAADDPFAGLMDLTGLGYTAAAKPNDGGNAPEKANDANTSAPAAQPNVSNEDAMYAYMYGTAPQSASQTAAQPQQVAPTVAAP